MKASALALVCAVGLLGLPAAGRADGATVSTSSLAGWSATASVGHWDDSGDSCYGHSAFVEAFDRRMRDDEAGPSNDLWLRLTLVESDRCSGMGTDVAIPGAAALAPGDFAVRGDLGAATLDATVAFRPYGSPSTWPVDIDLTWHAVDDAVGPRDRSMYELDGRRTLYRSMGGSRHAVVSGTVTVSGPFSGQPIDYGGDGSGSLFSANTGAVVIQK